MDECYIVRNMLGLIVETIKTMAGGSPPDVQTIFPHEELLKLHPRWNGLNKMMDMCLEVHPLIRSINAVLQSFHNAECELSGAECIEAYTEMLRLNAELLLHAFPHAVNNPDTPHLLMDIQSAGIKIFDLPSDAKTGSVATGTESSAMVHQNDAIDLHSFKTANSEHLNIGDASKAPYEMTAPREHPSALRPATLASVKEMKGVERAYLAHLAELPMKMIAVIVTNGVLNWDAYPTHLFDRTPVLLLSRYDSCVRAENQPLRWSGPRDRKSAIAIRQKAAREWHGRSNNAAMTLLEEDAEKGYLLSVAVYAKGIIPDGEEPFPKEYEGIPVHVTEARMLQDCL